jgi:MFS family permease
VLGYALGMKLMLDSFWRAVMYCMHPRVIALSLLPLALLIGVSFGLAYLYWDPAQDWVRHRLESYAVLETVWEWLQGVGLGSLKAVAAPLLVIVAVTPLLVVGTLLVVSVAMTPAMVSLVAERRFPNMERKRGAGMLASIAWSLLTTVLALMALVISMPLWVIPPLILILPPLIWGWLTYRVMAFDVLASHASKDERRQLLRENQSWFFAMGLVAGYLGAAPSLVWASGALFAAAFVFLLPVAIWIYTVVFAFTGLWFAHYGLSALDRLRTRNAAAAAVVVATAPASPPPASDGAVVTPAVVVAPERPPLALPPATPSATPPSHPDRPDDSAKPRL